MIFLLSLTQVPVPSGSGFGGGYDGFKLGAPGAPAQLETFVDLL